MDLTVHSQKEIIREIEDIIGIQKANGNFNIRQVAFKIPLATENEVIADFVKSLESGFTKSKSDGVVTKKIKKIRYKRGKSPLPLPDVISWPSDSDITVLRMKLCLNNSDIKEKVGNAIRGDGLHQPDSSSMINLATMIQQSEPPSKHSLNIEEYLLPLSSWEQQEQSENKSGVDNKQSNDSLEQTNHNFIVYDDVCSREEEFETLNLNNNDNSVKTNRKSKVAKFMRLYFCPCCTCLYKIEKMSDQPSSYFTRNNDL